MKVVDVAEFYADQGGGVKTYINQKLRAGAERGHEVVVIAPGPEDKEEERHGGRILWLKGPEFFLDPRYYILRTQARVHELLDAERPDVVEGSSPWRGGRYAGRWRGDAFKVFIFHQDPVAVYPETLLGGALGLDRVNSLFSPYWRYLKGFSEQYDATVVAGHWLAAKTKKFGLQDPVAIPFGIEKQHFSPTRRSDDVRRRWLDACGVPTDMPLLVTVSRFHPEKRMGTLINAVKQAQKQTPFAWVIFGGGPLEGWIKRKVAPMERCHVAGYTKNRDELADAMAAGDGFLHGSAAETFGLVVAEAMCSGLPLIVPDVGGAADLASPAYAEIYRTGDAAACSDAILRLLGRDGGSLRGAVAEAGANDVRTVDQHFDALFAFYESRVAAKRG
ncbi:MAG: alpha-1,6-mannosyltransferase [Bradymonadia bacterium]|jgi:alpha-1,6-mannosyltransferase